MNDVSEIQDPELQALAAHLINVFEREIDSLSIQIDNVQARLDILYDSVGLPPVSFEITYEVPAGRRPLILVRSPHPDDERSGTDGSGSPLST